MEEGKTVKETLKEEVEKILCDISEQGINESNIDFLYKLIDVHKDICNEDYWREKIMRYRASGNYSNYGEGSYSRRGVKGTGRGRYSESSRGGSRYSGENYMADMSDSYREYEDNRSRFGADESSMKALEEMLESVEMFMTHLEKNASNQEEVEMIKETAERIAR